MDLRVYLPLTFPLSLTEVSLHPAALLGKKKHETSCVDIKGDSQPLRPTGLCTRDPLTWDTDPRGQCSPPSGFPVKAGLSVCP